MTHPTARCPVCSYPIRSGAHWSACGAAGAPLQCVCDTPKPDGIGECETCHRRVIGLTMAEVRTRLVVIDPPTDPDPAPVDPFAEDWSYTWDEPA